MTRIVALLFFSSFISACAALEYYESESALRNKTLQGYEYKIRPSRTVAVKVNLSLLNINVLDVPSQSLSVSGWLTFTWHDSRLTWDKEEYGNITDIFDTELVFWRPEIIVDNSVDNLGILESDKLLIRATHEGNMTWEPPGIFETHCDVDVTFYPFDTQECVVEVTSWAHTVEEIDLYAEGKEIDLTEFEVNGEWDVISSRTHRKMLHDGVDYHTEIAFTIKLQRKPMYYVTTILIPVIVTSILCIVVFLLPAESGEKVGYSLTILLTYTVMLTLVASYMPPTSKHTSVLGVYLTIILFIGVVTTLVTVVVLHLHHHPNNKDVPIWLQGLARNIMVPISSWRPLKVRSASDFGDKYNNYSPQQIQNLGNVQQVPRRAMNKIYVRYPSDGRIREAFVGYGSQKLANGVAINGGMNNGDMKNDSRNQSPEEEVDMEHYQFTWREVGGILDAMCLRLLGGFVILLTIIVLLTMVIGGRW
ncbi:hypothetical protein BsWGS_25170 [Bradybaena similaris]